jgi:hypothetical protein
MSFHDNLLFNDLRLTCATNMAFEGTIFPISFFFPQDEKKKITILKMPSLRKDFMKLFLGK